MMEALRKEITEPGLQVRRYFRKGLGVMAGALHLFCDVIDQLHLTCEHLLSNGPLS